MTDSSVFKHHFLLAMPGLEDPNFSSTITYLFEHSENGAMGLVINRPSALTLGDMFDQLEIEGDHARDSPVLQGGPMERERGFILHGDDGDFDASVDLGNGIRLSTARQVLEAISEQFLTVSGLPNVGWIFMGLVLILVVVFEPLGLYGLWLRTKRYWKTWPF